MNFRRDVSSAIIPLLAGMLALPGSLQAAKLREAAAVTAGNDHLIRLDQVYFASAHNPINPNEWQSLTEALDFGIRALEVDYYDYGGHVSIPAQEYLQIADDLLAGGPIDRNRYTYEVRDRDRRWVTRQVPFPRFEVKHDPTAESSTTRLGEYAGWYAGIVRCVAILLLCEDPDPVPDELEYGNNCDDEWLPGAFGNWDTQLARCLYQVRRWSFDNPNHLPILLRLNVKQVMIDRDAWLLDALVRTSIGNRLVTPEDLRTGYGASQAWATLRERITHDGWPTVEALRGKILAFTYLGPVAFDNENDSHGNYIRAMLSERRDPGIFVCPESYSLEDITLGNSRVGRTDDHDPIRRAAAGYTVCTTLQTQAEDDWKTNAKKRGHLEVYNLLKTAEARNFLSEVWSYSPDTTGRNVGYNGQSWEYIARGVSIIERDRFFGLDFSHLPLVGVSGVTSYAFSIRQEGNPGYALTIIDPPDDPDDVSWGDTHSVEMRPYAGAADQHWVYARDNQIRSALHWELCLKPATHEIVGKPTAGAKLMVKTCWQSEFYQEDRFGWRIGHVDNADPKRGIQMMFRDRRRLGHYAVPDAEDPALLYITPKGFGPGELTVVAATDDRIKSDQLVQPEEPGRRNAEGRWALFKSAPTEDYEQGYVYRQHLTLYLDKETLIDRYDIPHDPDLGHLDSGYHLPPGSVLAGTAEGDYSITYADSWRDFLPFSEYTYEDLEAATYLPQIERELWRAAGYKDQHSGGKVLDGTLTWRGATLGRGLYAEGLFGYQELTYDRLAAEVLPAGEADKYFSALLTDVSDLPLVDWSDHPQPNGNPAWLMETHGVAGQPTEQSQYIALWQQNGPEMPADAIPYRRLPLDGRKWMLAEMVLDDTELALWRQWIDIQWLEIPIGGSPAFYALADKLLESAAEGATEHDAWLAMHTLCGLSQTPSPFCTVPEDYPHWYQLPLTLERSVFAEVTLAEFDRSAELPLWQAAAQIVADADGSPTWRDVPFAGAPGSDVTPADYQLIARVVLIPTDFQIWRLARDLDAVDPVTVTDIPPAGLYTGLAEDRLSAVDLERWLQRVSTEVGDIPLNPAADEVAQAFLDPSEYGEWQALLAEAESYAPMPSHWTDVPPSRRNQELAEALFGADGPVIADWLSAKALDDGTVDFFPRYHASAASRDLAELTLEPVNTDPDRPDALPEDQDWMEDVSDAVAVGVFDWLMIASDARADVVAQELLDATSYDEWQAGLGSFDPDSGCRLVNTNETVAAYGKASSPRPVLWQNRCGRPKPPAWTSFTDFYDPLQAKIVRKLFGEPDQPDRPQTINWMLWQQYQWATKATDIPVNSVFGEVAQHVLPAAELDAWADRSKPQVPLTWGHLGLVPEELAQTLLSTSEFEPWALVALPRVQGDWVGLNRFHVPVFTDYAYLTTFMDEANRGTWLGWLNANPRPAPQPLPWQEVPLYQDSRMVAVADHLLDDAEFAMWTMALPYRSATTADQIPLDSAYDPIAAHILPADEYQRWQSWVQTGRDPG